MSHERGRSFGGEPAAAPILESLESRLLLDGAPAGLIGDLNGDGAVTAADIDLLTTAIRTGTPAPGSDINADGAVTVADLTELLTKHLATYPGDANLDGKVDGLDFLAWQAGYPNASGLATWAGGDFDGDGNVAGSDFLAWQINYPSQRPASLQIVSTSADSTSPAAPLDYIDVTFNAPVDPATFTSLDASVVSATPDIIYPTTSFNDLNQLGPYIVGTGHDTGEPLQVLDFSNPSSLAVVGSYQSAVYGRIRGMDVAGSLAYVAVGDSFGSAAKALEVVDLSNPASPVLLSRYVLHWQSDVTEVEVVGQRAYVLHGAYYEPSQSVLEIIDVSTPSAPAFLGSVGGLSFVYGMNFKVDGSLVFAVGVAGLSIVDVSNPAAPAIVGLYSTSKASQVAVAGSVAYLVCSGAFEVVDVSDPAMPRQLASVALPNVGPSSSPTVAVDGARAYVDDAKYWTLQMFDVSDPASPKLLGEQGTLNSNELNIFGSRLFSSSGPLSSSSNTGIRAIDLLSGWSPMPQSSLALPNNASDVETVGSIAYVADATGGLRVVNVENPAAPQEIGSLILSGIAQRVTLQGNLAYVACSASLQIVDVSNPASPALVGSFTTPSLVFDVVVVGSVAYVAEGSAGLQIIDVSTPSSPQLLGTCDTPGVARGVAVAGSFAFVADSASGLQIIDVSNPSAPVLAATYNSGTTPDVAVAGNMAYVAGGTGLIILDVTAPAKPVMVGRASVSTPSRVEVVGSLVYVANMNLNFIGIYDVSVPSSPRLISAALAADAEVVGGYLVEGNTTIPKNTFTTAAFFGFVGSVTQLSPTTFRINLSTPLPAGTYFLQVGPIIAAADGRLLNTDGDVTAGEGNDDVFALRFEVAA